MDDHHQAGKAAKHLPSRDVTIDGVPVPAFIRPTAGKVIAPKQAPDSPAAGGSPKSLRQRILDTIEPEPLTNIQIAKQTGLTRKQVVDHICHLRSDGLVETQADGTHRWVKQPKRAQQASAKQEQTETAPPMKQASHPQPPVETVRPPPTPAPPKPPGAAKSPPAEDPELHCIGRVVAELECLAPMSRHRVVNYLADRYILVGE